MSLPPIIPFEEIQSATIRISNVLEDPANANLTQSQLWKKLGLTEDFVDLFNRLYKVNQIEKIIKRSLADEFSEAETKIEIQNAYPGYSNFDFTYKTQQTIFSGRKLVAECRRKLAEGI